MMYIHYLIFKNGIQHSALVCCVLTLSQIGSDKSWKEKFPETCTFTAPAIFLGRIQLE